MLIIVWIQMFEHCRCVTASKKVFESVQQFIEQIFVIVSFERQYCLIT